MGGSRRSSSREVRIRVHVFLFSVSVVYFSRGTLPQKKGREGHLAGGPRNLPTTSPGLISEMEPREQPFCV